METFLQTVISEGVLSLCLCPVQHLDPASVQVLLPLVAGSLAHERWGWMMPEKLLFPGSLL